MDSELLCHTETHKSMRPDEIHPKGLKELTDVITKPLSIFCQQSWLNREVPVDWKLASVMPNYKKGRKEDPEIYSSASLISVPWQVMEQI